MSNRRSLWLRRLEWTFVFVGTLCAAVFFLVLVSGWLASRTVLLPSRVEAQAHELVNRVRVNADAGGAQQAVIMGQLEIRKLGISVPILSDYESASLLQGVGHVPGTAMPGGLGTLGLAGHRDTYFRPLRNIEKDMEIRVSGEDGVYRYLVDSTEVVKPDNVEVLDIRSRPELTLITCYPFFYVGSAPMRFIVHAHLVSALPDAR